MGLVLLRGGEASEAIEVLQYALQIAPQLAGSHVNLGNAYKEAGLAEKAIAEFERAIELDPSLKDAYIALAALYGQAGNPAAAQKTLERYLAFMPQNITVRKALSDARVQ
jgi:Tfp pilus assembly protein PilF